MSASSHANDSVLLLRATTIAVGVACLLVFLKSYAAWKTDSSAVFGALFDSALDVFASMVNMIAVRRSLIPADEDHRFGHGRAEQLAALAQALFVSGSGLLIGARSFDRLLNPEPVAEVTIGVAVMAIAIVFTIGLVLYQRWVIAKTGSIVIRADSLHYVGDILLHAGVIAGLVAWSLFGWLWVDSAVGLVIAVWLISGGVRIGWEAGDVLMDRELDEATRRSVLARAHAHSDVMGAHDLRTRLSGSTAIVQLHIELSGEMSVRRAFEVAEEVKSAIREEVPGADVTIHQEPVQPGT